MGGHATLWVGCSSLPDLAASVWESLKNLRVDMADWEDCITDDSPMWAAYQDIMAGMLANLDNRGYWGVFQSILDKLIMGTGGSQANDSFMSVNPSAGFEAGIEGCIYSVCDRDELDRG